MSDTTLSDHARSRGMTPTRLRECLVLLRWSQRGLADALDRDEGLVRMMARGARPIPSELATWLETLAAVHEAHPAPDLLDGRRRTYRVVPGGFSPDQWVVVANEPGAPAVRVFDRRADAQAEVDSRNTAPESSDGGRSSEPRTAAALRALEHSARHIQADDLIDNDVATIVAEWRSASGNDDQVREALDRLHDLVVDASMRAGPGTMSNRLERAADRVNDWKRKPW